MKKLFLLVFSSLNILGIYYVNGQTPTPFTVSPQDSLALINLYNSTNGPNWTDQGKWLSDTLENWKFITIENGRIAGLNIPNNNLQGTIDSSINSLTALVEMDLSRNKIEVLPQLNGLDSLQILDISKNLLSSLPDFSQLNSLVNLKCQENLLWIDDVASLDTAQYDSLIYSPQQKKLHVTQFLDPDSTIPTQYTLKIEDTTPGNIYTWYRTEPDPNGFRSNNQDYVMPNVSKDSSAIYIGKISNPLFPGFELFRSDVILKVAPAEDHPFPPDVRDSTGRLRITLRFVPGTPDSVTNKARATLFRLGAEELPNACLCDDEFSAWYLPDPLSSVDGTFIGANEIIHKACEEIEANETGDDTYLSWDYPFSFLNNGPTANQLRIQLANPLTGVQLRPVKVGIIDLGIDRHHLAFKEYIWGNNDPLDCYSDDYWGYNFFHKDNYPFRDMTSHGTHIANIIENFIPNLSVQLLSLQVGEQVDDPRVFDVACAIRYAAILEVDVISLSMGYRGFESELLTQVIEELGQADSAIVLVTSAGNDSKLNNYENGKPGYWPGNLAARFSHVLTVGAMNEAYQHLAKFSNYGDTTVTIAAPGVNIWSAYTGNRYGTKSGTSMAVPFITAMMAWYKATLPRTQTNPNGVIQEFMSSRNVFSNSSLIDSIKNGNVLNVVIQDCSLFPEAQADSFTGSNDRILPIDVRWNDCHGQSILPVNVSNIPPSQGTLAVNSQTGIIVFTPHPDFVGTVRFSYDLCPGNQSNSLQCSTASVEIKVSDCKYSLLDIIRYVIILLVIIFFLIMILWLLFKVIFN
ncbi:MAG: S8 family serine peptidase [Bacteroidota bacterium]